MKAHLRIFGTALTGVSSFFLQYYQKWISPLDALAEFTRVYVRGEKCTAKHSAPRVIGPSLPGGGDQPKDIQPSRGGGKGSKGSMTLSSVPLQFVCQGSHTPHAPA